VVYGFSGAYPCCVGNYRLYLIRSAVEQRLIMREIGGICPPDTEEGYQAYLYKIALCVWFDREDVAQEMLDSVHEEGIDIDAELCNIHPLAQRYVRIAQLKNKYPFEGQKSNGINTYFTDCSVYIKT